MRLRDPNAAARETVAPGVEAGPQRRERPRND
jgi:hypothetical protein